MIFTVGNLRKHDFPRAIAYSRPEHDRGFEFIRHLVFKQLLPFVIRIGIQVCFAAVTNCAHSQFARVQCYVCTLSRTVRQNGIVLRPCAVEFKTRLYTESFGHVSGRKQYKSRKRIVLGTSRNRNPDAACIIRPPRRVYHKFDEIIFTRYRVGIHQRHGRGGLAVFPRRCKNKSFAVIVPCGNGIALRNDMFGLYQSKVCGADALLDHERRLEIRIVVRYHRFILARTDFVQIEFTVRYRDGLICAIRFFKRGVLQG